MDETHDHDEPHPWLHRDIVVRADKKVSMVCWIQMIQVWREGGGERGGGGGREKEEGKGGGEREGGGEKRKSDQSMYPCTRPMKIAR